MLPSKQLRIPLDEREIIIETGHLARSAGGAVTVRLGDTVVFVTAVVSKEPREGIDFFPLLVDFEEKMFSVGRLPGGFLRREGRPSDKAILISRLIDRPIRPLFPKNYRNDVQLTAAVYCSDGENQMDVLGMLGASIALELAGAPFQGPIGAVRVGRINGEFIANPTFQQNDESDLDIVVAGTEDSIMMVEAGAEFVSEEDIIESLKFAQTYISAQVQAQREFAKELGVEKQEFVFELDLEPLEKFVEEKCLEGIEKAYRIQDRNERDVALTEVKNTLKEAIRELEEDHPVKQFLSEHEKFSYDKEVFKGIEKRIMRSMIVDEKVRVDGRKVDEVRPIDVATGILPRTHGTGLFTRGNTQVLSVATLGPPGDAQELDGVDPQKKRRYLHHYIFPSFSVGEVRPNRGPGRREIGHGALAERAILPILPTKEEFPYTIRVSSEVLESNGSTSMASTCGSSLALMDAGVPVKCAIAGVAMGLIKEGDKVEVLTDIQGLEDFLGDMDFKVTGNDTGITALQMDIKIQGISIPIMERALEQARVGRLHILGKMNEVIDKANEKLSDWAPSIITCKIDTDDIGGVIGPGGKTIRGIIEETNATIDIENDGTVLISAVNQADGYKALGIIKKLTKKIERGNIFAGKVARIIPNLGALVELLPGKDGMVHISQIAQRRVNRIEDELNVGDEVIVKVTEIDDRGRVNLTIKGLTPQEKDKFLEEEYC